MEAIILIILIAILLVACIIEKRNDAKHPSGKRKIHWRLAQWVAVLIIVYPEFAAVSGVI